MIDTSKVIHAPVGGGRYTVTAPIVKEDYGLYLLIEGLELPSTYEVDFSNSENNGTSVTMIGNADGVLIPSQFISSGKDVFAFLYHVGVDFGRTVYKFRIPNKLRPDRTDEQPTPEEQSIIDQAISALNTAVEQTAQDKADADVSAQNASADADRAEEAKTDAQNYATQAEQSAISASQSASQASASATASAQSASQSAQIKADVEDLADDAQASASASAQSATASANSASQASASATSASQSATSASGYATSAQTSAQTASAKASEASTSAQTASNKASEASQSASQALTYKTDAESAKTASQTAQGLAESARDSAITAKDDAEDARDEAQSIVDGISGKTEQIDSNTERIESLEDDRYKPYANDTASGAIASFSDGADDLLLKSLVVDINPVQDLHGQDAPYPAGGETNKWDENWELGSLNSNTGLPIDSTTLIRSKDFCECLPSTEYAKVCSPTSYVNVFWYDENQAFISLSDGGGNNPYSVITSPSNAKYFKIRTESAYGTTYKNDIAINYPSTVTTYSPYENICPISGWTGVNISASGKNLFNKDACQVVDKYYIDESGNFVSHVNYVCTETYQPVESNTQYVLSGTIVNNGTYNAVAFYDKDKRFISRFRPTTGVNAVFTTPSDCAFIRWNMRREIYDLSTIQLEKGGTATAYEPFRRSIPISWQTEAGTVYGGKLDVLSGVLTVDRAVKVFDGGFTRHSSLANAFYKNYAFDDAGAGNVISNQYKYTTNVLASLSVGYFTIDTNYTRLALKTDAFATRTEFNAYLSENPLVVVYPLATPQSYQLDAHTVNSLLGQNNIFADTGDVSCEYRADTRLYIEKLTQPEEDDMVANSAIASGQFFMIGNSLYKALTAIASGATITVGTNAQRVSLSDALNLVNA